MMQNYLEFRAAGNTVLGVLDSDDGEVTVMVCTCAAIPGKSAEEVAQEIAGALNATNAETIKGMGFSLPYEDVSEKVQGAIGENHTD